MKIYSKHKRFDLAERHLRQLSREYASAKIVARKNVYGLFSKRGHFYTFEVTKKKKRKKPKLIQWLISGSYEKGKGAFAVDVVVQARANATESEILDLVSNGHGILREGGFRRLRRDGKPNKEQKLIGPKWNWLQDLISGEELEDMKITPEGTGQ